MKVPVYI